MSSYKNSGGFWPRAIPCSNGNLLVGSGTMTTAKGKKIEVVMFADLPDSAPKELKKLHEEYWTAMSDFGKKRTKKKKKKGGKNTPFFKFKKS